MRELWLERLKEHFKNATIEDTARSIRRLQAQGLIDENWNVTGKLHRWDAVLAVTEVSYDGDDTKIKYCNCFLPVFGMPQGEIMVLSRESLLDYFKRKKKVITAWWDDDLRMWREGDTVRRNKSGHLRTDRSDEPADQFGQIPVNNTLKPAV